MANVAAAVALGVAFSLWMLRYTSWFPIFGGLLALTGAFSWIAFLSNVISEERKKQAQAFLDRALLQNWLTLVCMSLLTASFLLIFAPLRGTLILDSFGEDVSRTGTITRESGDARRIALAARSESVMLLPTRWWQAEAYRVKLDGLPEIAVNVRPWRRARIIAPADFWATPVVLIRPTITMSGDALPGDFDLVVEVNDRRWRVSPYHGGTVWVGASSDVEIPAARIDRWRMEFLHHDFNPALVHRWTLPAALDEGPRLQSGDRLVVRVELPGSPPVQQGIAEARVQPVRSPGAFPQELVIDVVP
ncbi:MAG: hypothetical protein JJT90_14280 [Ectothiorhodospiraceae bacterium]|nr:hypothetical protein [Ectothiorhodospiraceae bacterium]